MFKSFRPLGLVASRIAPPKIEGAVISYEVGVIAALDKYLLIIVGLLDVAILLDAPCSIEASGFLRIWEIYVNSINRTAAPSQIKETQIVIVHPISTCPVDFLYRSLYKISCKNSPNLRNP